LASRQVTLAEVAKQAGVSLATASRVLNGSTRQVSEELRERVLGTARKLGYLPNASAQALARNSSVLVGLVVHDIADPYFSSIAAGVTRIAEDAGLVVVLGTTGRDPDREVELVNTLRAHRARAVVIAGSRTTDRNASRRLAEEITAFTAQGGRVACVSQAKLGTDTVVPANRSGARALARQLAALGHREFAVLAGPPQLLVARDRLAGFKAGLADEGLDLPDANVFASDFTRDGGHAAMAGHRRAHRRDLRVRRERRHGDGRDGGSARARAAGAGRRLGGRVRRHPHPARPGAGAEHGAAAAGGDGRAGGPAGAGRRGRRPSHGPGGGRGRAARQHVAPQRYRTALTGGYSLNWTDFDHPSRGVIPYRARRAVRGL
jgi:DNA-binding LacI/PurR family transcriptional regulator